MDLAKRSVLDTRAAARMMRLSRPPPTRNLRVFCVAARHRSFKLAADELYLTPSAVSHQMKELEETLGVRLFVRRSRALELTTAGATLLDEIEPLLSALDRTPGAGRPPQGQADPAHPAAALLRE